jgi:predicted Zn-dependent peptidase
VFGAYPAFIDDYAGKKLLPKEAEPPPTEEVLARRLGIEPPIDTIGLVSRATLETFRAHSYVPARATLIVSGNFDLAKMRHEVRTLFSQWHSADAASALPPSMPVAQPGFVAIPVLHANTLGIAIGFASAQRTSHADDAARAVLIQIISERLRVVRESLGASYGMFSTYNGGVVVGGDVEPAYAAEAAHAILDALAHVREGDAAFVADFVSARKYVLARALAQPLGASARAAQLQRAVEAGHGVGDLDAETEAIRTLDIKTVRDVAARELKPERMITVVRGTPDAIRAALAAFGATAFDTVTR